MHKVHHRAPKESDCVDDHDRIDKALARPWYVSTLSADLEQGYEAASRSTRRKGLRVYLGTILIIIDLCFPFDLWAGVRHDGGMLRFGVVTPLICLSLWLLRRSRPILVESCLALASVITVVGTITFLGLKAQPPYTEGYLMAAGMIGFAVNLSMPLRIQQAWMLYAGNVTIYCGLAMSGLFPSRFPQTSVLVVFFSITMLATLRHAVRREQDKKTFIYISFVTV